MSIQFHHSLTEKKMDKAISPNSPYYGQDDAALMVAQNIDALNNFI